MSKLEIDTAITATGLKGSTSELSFSGVTSFARRKYTKDLTGVDVAVTGVPVDVTVTHRAGTRFGPRQIREMSSMLAWDTPYGWPRNPLEELAIIDYGDVALDHGRWQDMPGAVTNHIAGILDAGATSLVLGGDHFITLPILRAYAAKHGPVSVLQFDAHSDTWPDADPTRLDHGTMMYHAVNEGLVDAKNSVQVGIRTTNDDTMGFHTLDARSVHEAGPVATAKRIKEIIGDKPVYLTFDIDCLDPGFAPGTGTPVFGGLSPGQIAIILRDIAGLNVIGGDVVEVSPPYDPSGATAIAGSQIAMEILCLMAHKDL